MDAALIKDLTNAYALAVAGADLGQPNGHLYAMIALPLGAGLEEHNIAIKVLKDTGLVEEESFFLTWSGTDEMRDRLRAVMEG